MLTFEDRERAFEAKFAHDEEFRFLVTARRDKLFAQWAAARCRLSGPAAADPCVPGRGGASDRPAGVSRRKS